MRAAGLHHGGAHGAMVGSSEGAHACTHASVASMLHGSSPKSRLCLPRPHTQRGGTPGQLRRP